MSAHAVHIVSLPGWLFPATVFASLSPSCPTACWTHLPWETALDADRLRAAIAAETVPCLLLAWSLGALAALRLAADPPPALRALVLLGATARLSADPTTNYPGVAPAVFAAMRRRLNRDPDGLFRDFHALCHRPDTATSEATDAFAAAARAHDASLADAGLAALATGDFRSQIDCIPILATLIHGEADAVVPVTQAHAVADALPGGRVLTLPRCGHFPSADLLTVAGDVLAHYARSCNAGRP